jgi:RNA polymerase sigma-70 factor (ECF subfamily)
MASDLPSIDTTLLLAQSDWVHSLARNLVRDPDGADDVAQETILAALRAPPRDATDEGKLKAWLGRVTFNLARLSARRAMRREAREANVARSERTDSTADRVARESVMRVVAEAVSRLEQPYRTAVVLRYFRGLCAAEIAHRTGTTEGAVRKRLFRARERLRQELDTRHRGDHSSWFNALLPLALKPAFPRTLPVGKLAASLALAGGAGLAVLGAFARDEQASAQVSLATPELGRAELPSTGVVQPIVRNERVTWEDPARPLPPPEDELLPDSRRGRPPLEEEPRRAAASLHIRGHVLDLYGQPLAGLAVVDEGDPERILAWSGPRGEFVADVARRARLALCDDAVTTLRRPTIGPGAESVDHWILAAPVAELVGRVVDQRGLPIPSARLSMAARDELFLALDVPMRLTEERPVQGVSDALGGFELHQFPWGRGIEIVVACEGFVTLREAVSERPVGELTLLLERVRGTPIVVSGHVRFDTGEPAVGATVEWGRETTRTGRDGGFSLRADDPGSGDALVARLAGYDEAEIPDFGGQVSRGGDRPEPVSLVLQGEVRSIGGRILVPDGIAHGGWIVQAFPSETERGVVARDGGPAHERGSTPAGGEEQRPALGSSAVTDPDGRFHLRGMMRGSHRLVAWDPRTLACASIEPVADGARSVELVLEEDAWMTRLHGRILLPDGSPVADAEVALELDLAQFGARAADDTRGAGGPCARTDELGRFELVRVPRQGVSLRLAHASVASSAMRVEDLIADPATGRARDWCADPISDLQLVLGDLAPSSRSFVLSDASGRPLELATWCGSATRGALDRGRSGRFGATGGAAGVTLFDEDGQALGTFELSRDGDVLVPGP